jgi:uncharacterized protein YggE
MSTSDLTLPRQRLGLLSVGALAGVLVAAVVGPSMQPVRAADEPTEREHIISVSGVGTVKIKPDVADVSLGVSIQRDRAGDASIDAANAMAQVIAALQAAGIAEDDIQTATLSLDSVWDYDREPARIVGYQATNIVNVTVRDLEAVGTIIDAAVDAGANSIGGIGFRVEDPSSIEAQARDAAMADAKAKADALAGAAGVTITGVISIVETSSPIPLPYYAEADMAAGRAASTPVLAGNVDVTVNVAVVYSIG